MTSEIQEVSGVWTEVIGAGRDSFRVFFCCCWGGGLGFFLPLSESKPHINTHMCAQLLQKGHMKEILTDATVFFLSSIFC